MGVHIPHIYKYSYCVISVSEVSRYPNYWVLVLTSCREVLGSSSLVLMVLLFLLAASSSSSVSSSLAGQESIPVAAKRTSGIWKSSCSKGTKDRQLNIMENTHLWGKRQERQNIFLLVVSCHGIVTDQVYSAWFTFCLIWIKHIQKSRLHTWWHQHLKLQSIFR